MNKRILFATGEGIGNVVQIAPTLRTIKEVLGFDIDLWLAFGSYTIPKDLFPYVSECYIRQEIRKMSPMKYYGLVSTFWAQNHVRYLLEWGMKHVADIYPITATSSEVATYMRIARRMGVKEEDIIWEGECNYTPMDYSYDVVIHNGYNRYGSADWSIKSYQHYGDVAWALQDKGYNVASVGSRGEYISGTSNQTGLDLLSTIGIIKNSKLFLSNDSGLYHCANAVKTDNIVIFTATSIIKNYDSRFHKYSTIIGRDDLECRPCQVGRGWKKCDHWGCREINPQIICDAVMERLNEYKPTSNC